MYYRFQGEMKIGSYIPLVVQLCDYTAHHLTLARNCIGQVKTRPMTWVQSFLSCFPLTPGFSLDKSPSPLWHNAIPMWETEPGTQSTCQPHQRCPAATWLSVGLLNKATNYNSSPPLLSIGFRKRQLQY